MVLIFKANAALICRTTTAFSHRKPPIFLEEPTDRKPKLFANADGHDLARCYALFLYFVSELIWFFPH
jgi:hypothetical protein